MPRLSRDRDIGVTVLRQDWDVPKKPPRDWDVRDWDCNPAVCCTVTIQVMLP